MNPAEQAYFYACAALAVGGSLSVVIAKNPIRSAMGLLLLILSVAGLFIELHAQFLAAVQLIVYAGAIVVLFLFVIMLLGPSASPPHDGRGIVVRVFSGGLFGLAGLGALGAIANAAGASSPRGAMGPPDASFGGIDAIGGALFSDAVVPFELSSALLMVAVVGAVAVARGRQGIKELSHAEQDVAKRPESSGAAPVVHSGVFSHEIHAAAADGTEGPA